MRSRTWVITAAAGIATLAVFAMLSMAGAQDGGEGRLDRQGIAERVAEKLGVDVETLRNAYREARLEIVDEALAAGRITDEQAERARERIEQGKPPASRRLTRMHARKLIVESAATALAITPQELRDELRAGKSIADVAIEQGVGLDAVKQQITTDAAARLDELVDANRLDRARADAMLDQLTQHLDEILQRSRE